MKISRLLPLFILCLPSPSASASTEAQRAAMEYEGSGTCSISGLGPMRKLIRRYDKSADPDTQIIVAKARFAEAFVYWFRQDEAADSLLKKLIRRYDYAGNPKLEAVAAQARTMIVQTKRNPKLVKKFINPVVARYKNAADVDLARAYATALYRLSDLEREAGHEAEAQRLSKEAGTVYATIINPRQQTANTSAEDTQVCV